MRSDVSGSVLAGTDRLPKNTSEQQALDERRFATELSELVAASVTVRCTRWVASGIAHAALQSRFFRFSLDDFSTDKR